MSFQLITPAYAAVTLTSNVWETAGCANQGVVTIRGVECLINNLLVPIPGLIALAAVGMIIFAGIRIVTAGADAKALTSAWNTFTYAVIGLILLSVVWFVLVLIERFTGAPVVTNFGITS